MRLAQVRAIYLKEMRDILRDRRTLFVMIVLPILLYPLLMIGVLQFSILQARRLRAETAKVAVIGAQIPTELREAFDSTSTIQIVKVRDWRQALRSGDLHAVLRIPPGFSDSIGAHHLASLSIYYSGAKERSGEARNKIERVLQRYRDTIVAERFEALSADTSLLRPFATDIENIATTEEMSGFALGKFLGYLLIVMVMMGAFYPAIDLTAGEKERGTLETLLVSPAQRSEIVYGKFFAILSVSMITALLNIGSMGLTFSQGMQLLQADLGAKGFGFGVTPLALASLTLLLVPIAVFFSAICMAVATPARSYKEGQNLLTPIYIVVILPAIASVLPGVEISPSLALIPIVNVSLLTKEFLMGRYPLVETALTFLSSCLLAALALRWAISQFQRESVLFRHAEDVRWSPFRRPLIARPLPSASAAFTIYVIVLILVFFLGTRWQSEHLLQGLFRTEVLLILLPPLLVLSWGRHDVRRALGLRRTPAGVWLPTLIFMVGGWFLAVEIASIQNFFLPFPSELMKSFEWLFTELNRLPIYTALFYVAILPGFCEEIFCRGFLLQAWLPRLGRGSTILAIAVVFGILHLNPYRFLPTAFLGGILAVLVIESGSIFPAMFGHALVNGATFLIQRQEELFAKGTSFQVEQDFLPWYLVVAGVLLFGVGWMWLRSVTAKDKETSMADSSSLPSSPS
jgi:sodium transport system permease protein